MTIVEAVIAASILLVAMLGGFLAIESASSATKSAERQAIAAAAGERELERLAGKDFASIVHCTAPAHNADPGAPAGQVPENPSYYVVPGSPPTFKILADYRRANSGPLNPALPNGETLAVAPAGNCPSGGMGTPQTSFESGGVTGTVWRFATIREDSCPPNWPDLLSPLEGLLNGVVGLVSGLLGDLTAAIGAGVNIFCNQPQDSKRITVAVVVDDASTLGPRKPTWMSTIVTDTKDGLVLNEDSRLDF